MNLRIPLLAACLAAVCVCGRAAAQTSTPADSAAPAPAHRAHHDANLITADEITGVTARDAYEVVTRLRPRWLRGNPNAASRGGNHTDRVWVYLDGTRVGPMEELRRINVATIGELRFVPGDEATARWGQGYGAGAILVTSR